MSMYTVVAVVSLRKGQQTVDAFACFEQVEGPEDANTLALVIKILQRRAQRRRGQELRVYQTEVEIDSAQLERELREGARE